MTKVFTEDVVETAMLFLSISKSPFFSILAYVSISREKVWIILLNFFLVDLVHFLLLLLAYCT